MPRTTEKLQDEGSSDKRAVDSDVTPVKDFFNKHLQPLESESDADSQTQKQVFKTKKETEMAKKILENLFDTSKQKIQNKN
jgi:hypothetical protein